MILWLWAKVKLLLLEKYGGGIYIYICVLLTQPVNLLCGIISGRHASLVSTHAQYVLEEHAAYPF